MWLLGNSLTSSTSTLLYLILYDHTAFLTISAFGMTFCFHGISLLHSIIEKELLSVHPVPYTNQMVEILL
jgi:hypothetical protein